VAKEKIGAPSSCHALLDRQPTNKMKTICNERLLHPVIQESKPRKSLGRHTREKGFVNSKGWQ
jgi:hypothetical protein